MSRKLLFILTRIKSEFSVRTKLIPPCLVQGQVWIPGQLEVFGKRSKQSSRCETSFPSQYKFRRRLAWNTQNKKEAHAILHDFCNNQSSKHDYLKKKINIKLRERFTNIQKYQILFTVLTFWSLFEVRKLLKFQIFNYKNSWKRKLNDKT